MKVTFQLEGAAELSQQLESLTRRLQLQVGDQALRTALEPLRQAVAASARSLVGGHMGELLARNLVMAKPRRRPRPGTRTQLMKLDAVVQEFIYEAKRTGKRSYIPAAIEYGHTTGGTYVPPIPFARTAADASQGEVIRILSEQLRIGLLRASIKGGSAT